MIARFKMELVLFYAMALLLFAPLRSAAQGWTDWSDRDTCSGHWHAEETPPAFAFHAYSLRERSQNPHPGDIIIFARTLVNHGGAYDTDNGIFYSPQRGTYTFFAHVCVEEGTAMSFSIMVRGERYASSYGRGLDDCHCSSVQAIASLERGDKVYIQRNLDDRDTSSVICEERPWNTFSGVLNFLE